MWARGGGYSQLIWAHNRDVIGPDRLCSQAATDNDGPLDRFHCAVWSVRYGDHGARNVRQGRCDAWRRLLAWTGNRGDALCGRRSLEWHPAHQLCKARRCPTRAGVATGQVLATQYFPGFEHHGSLMRKHAYVPAKFGSLTPHERLLGEFSVQPQRHSTPAAAAISGSRVMSGRSSATAVAAIKRSPRSAIA